MSRTQRLSDTGKLGRDLAAWLDEVGISVVDVRGSKHWRVRLASPDGRTMLLPLAGTPTDHDDCLRQCKRQVRRVFNLPRGVAP